MLAAQILHLIALNNYLQWWMMISYQWKVAETPHKYLMVNSWSILVFHHAYAMIMDGFIPLPVAKSVIHNWNDGVN